MAYDDIIIGAGMSGLATAMGLDPNRRVLVLTESEQGQIRYYDSQCNVPCAARRFGGLGNYWHGVISFKAKAEFAKKNANAFRHLFNHFYPQVDITGRFGTDWLFVPRQPIRPAVWWPRLVGERAGRLELTTQTALKFSASETGVEVQTGSDRIAAGRVWICAGALDTPGLLARSIDADFGARGTASDHAIIYLGQQARNDQPEEHRARVQRISSGYWLKTSPASTADCLVTGKPAWFSYRRLDHGIEQRAAFGLPVGGAIGKILRAGSLGLLSEAAFNKFGLFANSPIVNMYGQVRIEAAYMLDVNTGRLTLDEESVRRQLDSVRRALDLPGFTPSRRPELFIRGIHLHDTLDANRLAGAGVNSEQSLVQVQDASAIGSIGGEHHSFHMMAAAFAAARQA